jgi:hypothetical protein
MRPSDPLYAVSLNDSGRELRFGFSLEGLYDVGVLEVEK